LATPAVATAWYAYREGFARQHRAVDRLYRRQRLGVQGVAVGGKLDLYRVVAERVLGPLGFHGAVGGVGPSAFHANEGATSIRQHYLMAISLEWCLSFENRRNIFDIHARFKFALIVGRRPGPTRSVRCGFYLDDPWQIDEPRRLLQYDRAFIDAAG